MHQSGVKDLSDINLYRIHLIHVLSDIRIQLLAVTIQQSDDMANTFITHLCPLSLLAADNLLKTARQEQKRMHYRF